MRLMLPATYQIQPRLDANLWLDWIILDFGSSIRNDN